MNYLSQQNPEIVNGKRVIVRVDFNVPVEVSAGQAGNGVVSESEAFRIHAVVPTITWLQHAGAKIILISHIGRLGDSLQPVADYLKKYVPELDVQFIPYSVGEWVQKTISDLQNGEILLLENIRQHSAEELNDPEFAKKLASYADYYVNDAFAVSHREHASIVGIPAMLERDHCFVGLLFEKEIQNLNRALQPQSPSVLIMAGIKFETKLPLIEKLLPLYDVVLLGGGLLNTYLKASHISVGTSVVDDSANLSRIIGNTNIIIPEHVVVERKGSACTILTSHIQDNDIIVDVVISNHVKELLSRAATVVWNGPLGWYEKGYMKSSQDIIKSFGPETKSIVGGGDTVTVVNKLGLEHHISFISSGGGAMLEYLKGCTIIGILTLK